MLTLADIRRRVRSRLDDTAEPYLWPDIELNDAINDALWDASIRAHLVVQDDIAIPFTQKADLTWNSKYALSSGILDIKSVYLASSPELTLTRTSIRRREQYYGGRPQQSGSPTAYALDLTLPGTGEAYGQFIRAITFIGTPTKADTAYVDAARLPALLEVDTDVPEIDPMYHPDLVYGACERAYMKSDIDSFDADRMAVNANQFEMRFGPRLSACVLRERQTEVPYEMIVR